MLIAYLLKAEKLYVKHTAHMHVSVNTRQLYDLSWKIFKDDACYSEESTKNYLDLAQILCDGKDNDDGDDADCLLSSVG